MDPTLPSLSPPLDFIIHASYKNLKEIPTDHFSPNQKILLSAQYLFDVKDFSEFETLFSYLPSLIEENQKTGRPRTPSISCLKCFIYMSISGLKNLSEKKVASFWRYKNHVLSDAASEIPLFELTKPTNVNEGKLLIPIVEKFKRLTGVSIEAIIGDAAYTSRVKSLAVANLKNLSSPISSANFVSL